MNADLAAFALSAGLAAWSPAPVPPPASAPLPRSGPDAIGAPDWRRLSWEALLSELSRADVVAVGENHDDPAHHLAQARLLDALAAAPGWAVGFEMIPAEEQPTLDAFFDGRMGEPEFAAWWKRTWGYDYALYKPVFDAARARGVRAYGLNAPKDVVRAVAKKGLAGLTPAERGRLPASVRPSGDARYAAYVRQSIIDQHGGSIPPERLERMTEAMSAWNETMGDSAAALGARGLKVLVIAGQGHTLYSAGLLESARRRGSSRTRGVLPYPPDGEIELADFFLLP